MGKHVKNIVVIIIVAFVLFNLFTNPDGSAEAVRTVAGWLNSVVEFFSNLVS